MTLFCLPDFRWEQPVRDGDIVQLCVVGGPVAKYLTISDPASDLGVRFTDESHRSDVCPAKTAAQSHSYHTLRRSSVCVDSNGLFYVARDVFCQATLQLSGKVAKKYYHAILRVIPYLLHANSNACAP